MGAFFPFFQQEYQRGSGEISKNEANLKPDKEVEHNNAL